MTIKQTKIIAASVIVILITVIGILAFLRTKQEGGNRWCFASYAPHGAIWDSNCYDSKKECNNDLKRYRADYMTVNTKSCYKEKWIDGFCLEGVYTGETRADDVEFIEYRVMSYICTKTQKECEKFHQYQRDYSKCFTARVRTRESEEYYLTPASRKSKVIKAGPVDRNKCSDFMYAPNQQQAFENLGLDWENTKNWGAFIDTNDILRADKPSCREIVKDSAEYNKYKIKRL